MTGIVSVMLAASGLGLSFRVLRFLRKIILYTNVYKGESIKEVEIDRVLAAGDSHI